MHRRATPLGIRAAQMMAAGERAGNALCLFPVINSSSVQLLPSTVMALRGGGQYRRRVAGMMHEKNRNNH